MKLQLNYKYISYKKCNEYHSGAHANLHVLLVGELIDGVVITAIIDVTPFAAVVIIAAIVVTVVSVTTAALSMESSSNAEEVSPSSEQIYFWNNFLSMKLT
jgi:hypothetical protein